MKTRFFYGWVVVALSFLLGFLGTGFYSYARGVFLPSLADALADGKRMPISIGFSIAAITVAIIAPRLGRYLDSGSPRKVIMFGILVTTFAYFGLGVVQNLWQFYVIVGLAMGIGVSCMGGLSWHRSVIFWFDHWRGRAIAIAVLGASAAGILMPWLVNLLVEIYGWRTTYFLFGLTTFVSLMPLIYWLMRDRPEDIGEVRDGHNYVANHETQMVEVASDGRVWTLQELLSSPAFWSIGLIFGAMTCVFAAAMLHLYAHGLDVGLSTGDAALVVMAAAALAAAGKPVIGWMSDFWGARITIWLSLFCQGVALLIFTQAADFATVILGACIYGFGYSGMSPLRTFAISTSVSSASFAFANGVLRWVELPFILGASPLVGYVHDVTGSYNLAFYILTGLMVVAAIGPFFIARGGAVERRSLKSAAS